MNTPSATAENDGPPRHRAFRFRNWLAFPLLGKELTEAAARRRTYGLRVVYGVLLYGLLFLSLPEVFRSGAAAAPFGRQATDLLGTGRRMLEMLVELQIGAIGLFLPALMCGRITAEKERDSLVLLFLTELGPWRIVLEKYLGGLVPMLSCLLLALPLGAVAFAFGGFEPSLLLVQTGLLSLLLLQVGALALACSAWCRTTVGAFISTYLVGIAIIFLPQLFIWAMDTFFGATLPYATRSSLERWARLSNPLTFFPSGDSFPFLYRAAGPFVVFGALGVHLLSIPLLLLLARIGLTRRAFAPPENFLRRSFRWLDAVMQRANRLVGNITVLRPRASLPENEPIAWRELTRSGLGQPHHLVRILCVVETLVVLGCLAATAGASSVGPDSGELTVMMALVCGLSALFLCVQSANAFVSERVHQSLDVLLTTPLSARQIVAEKARALQRLAWVLAIPILTAGLFKVSAAAVIARGSILQDALEDDGPLSYTVCLLLAVAIYLPMILWLSLWIGLKSRNRFQAILTAVGTFVGWCVTPLVLLLFIGRHSSHFSAADSIVWIAALSPAGVVTANEFFELESFSPNSASPWLVLAVNFPFYFMLLCLFRRMALTQADRFLRQ